MPIRFRCAYCNQLMGISRRKAGTIVRCPKCSGQVVVPNPEDQPAEDDSTPPAGPQTPSGAGKALEDLEVDALLAGAASEAAAKKPRASRASTKPAPVPVHDPHPTPLPPSAPGFDSDPYPEVDVEPVDGSAPAPAAVGAAPPPAALPAGRVVVRRSLLIGLAVIAVLVIGLSFVAGYFVGRHAGEPALPPAVGKDG